MASNLLLSRGVRAFSQKTEAGIRCASPGLRATIFGAYGFVGRYVTSLLAGDGVQCIIPWRGDDMEWRHLKVCGDLGVVIPRPYSPKDTDSIRRCIEGSDIVINLVGKVRRLGSGFTYICPPSTAPAHNCTHIFPPPFR